MPLDAARDGLIAVQARLIVMLAARNADLEQRNAGLEARVGEMEERLESAVSRNSGNSSMPPSADDLPGRTGPGPGEPARRSGGAPGLAG